MELRLVRRWLNETTTLGELYVDGEWFCFTLEDCYRLGPKVPGQTCIPVGRYEVILTHSPRFGVDMPLLLSVPDFEGVRIHPGNKAADTEGCILVGRRRLPDMIGESRDAYAALFRKIEGARASGKSVHINIVVEPEEPPHAHE